MKLLYEILTYPLTVIGNPLIDLILLSILASVSFKLSWNIVSNTEIRGFFGSVLHWTIRIVSMFILTAILSFFIKLGIFLYSIPFEVWIMLSVVFITSITGLVTIRKIIFNKQNVKF